MTKLVLFKGSAGEDIYLNPQHVEALVDGATTCRVEMASGAVWNIETRAEDAIVSLKGAADDR